MDQLYDFERQLQKLAAKKKGGIKNKMQMPTMQELLQVRASLAHTSLSEHVAVRDMLICDFMQVYLLRISEVCSLNERAFDWKRMQFTIFPFYEKNAREKTYSLHDAPPWFLKELKYYLRRYRRTFNMGYLFPSLSVQSKKRPFVLAATWIHERWNKAVVHSGLADYRITLDGRRYSRLRTHHFRALGITSLLNAGWTIKEVQSFTQHACPETILNYYWLINAEKSRAAIMHKVIRKLPAPKSPSRK